MKNCDRCGGKLTTLYIRDAYTAKECSEKGLDPNEPTGKACFNPECPKHPDMKAALDELLDL
jgi:hypothetical protein